MKRSSLLGAVVFVAMLALVYWRIQATTPHPIVHVRPPGSALAGANQADAEAPVFPITLKSGSGRYVTLASAPHRIVSLAPSTTEILYAIGAADRIAADTTACDYPPAAASKPHIGGYSDMSLERIMAQNPDFIVADSSINEAMIGILQDQHVPVLDINAHSIDDVYNSILDLGRATGQWTQASGVVSDMKKRMAALANQMKFAVSKPKVLIMYSVAPIYTTGPGSYIDDIITAAGGHNIVAAGQTQITPSEALAEQPDVIICSDMLISEIEREPNWPEEIPAVKHHLYFDPTAPAVLVRPVPRLVDGAEQLARFLHPELYSSTGQPAELSPAPHAVPQSNGAPGSR